MLWNVIIPLAKPGIAIGTIFVVTLVMGDFITVRLMSGGQSASVGADDGEPDLAAAVSRPPPPTRWCCWSLVLLMVAGILRIVDIRKEL